MRRFFYLKPILLKVIIICLLLFLYINTREVSSSDFNIVINEVFPDAIGSDTGKEWIEVYNPTDQSISINGWYFKNISQSGGVRTITIPNLTLGSMQYIVISESNSNLNISNIYYLTDSVLNMYNSNSTLELYDNLSNLVDRVEYIGGEGNSIERIGILCSGFLNNINPTPGIKNFNYDQSCNIEEDSNDDSVGVIDLEEVNLKFNEVILSDNILDIELINIDGVEGLEDLEYVLKINGIENNHDLTCSDNNWCNINVTIVDNYIVDKVELYYNESLVDELVFNPKLEKDISYSLFENIWSYTIFKTMGYENILNIYSDIYITEVFSSPENGEDEWLEIYNYSISDINLKNFYLKERLSNGEYSNTKNYLSDFNLKSNTHYSISGFNLTLNNSGDKIGIFLNDTLIDEISYPSISYSKSYYRNLINNKYIDKWSVTNTPTRDEFNQESNPVQTEKIITTELYTNALDIFTLKDFNKGTKVKVKGCLNSDIGIISENVVYIQDSTSGIRVKFNQSEDLFKGDCIELNGKISTYRNERYINIDKYNKIDRFYNIEIINLELDQLDISHIGKIVKFKGDITRKNSTSFKVNNLINIYPLEFFNISDLNKEKLYSFTGVVSYENNIFRVYILSEDGIVEYKEVLGLSTPLSYSNLFNNINDLSINNDSYILYPWPIYLLLIVLSLCIFNLESLKILSAKIIRILKI